MSEKLIVESKVKALLLQLPGVKSVGQEVLDMLSEGVRTAATATIMGMCRVTPGGRLLLAEDGAERACAMPQSDSHPGWGPYNEWQREIRLGLTKLKFEEWSLGRRTEIEQVDKAERKGLTGPAEKA